jgi:hypothetical protein
MICSRKKEITEARVKSREDIKQARINKPNSSNTAPPVFDTTGLVCWWCVHALPQSPCIHLPTRYDDKLDKFTTTGNFCSWQCAKAYALDMNSSRSGEIQMFLALMRRRALGQYTPLWPAPKRQFLKSFGGSMTIEEFRSYGGLVEPPQLFYPIEHQVRPIFSETLSQGVVRGAAAAPTADPTRLRAIENSTEQQETLKLRRNKPLARAASKLESTLGIIRKAK